MDSQNIVDGPIRAMLSETLAEASTAYLVNPAVDAISELVDVLREFDEPPTVSLLAPEPSLKAVMDDFLVASVAAELIDTDVLAIRLLDEQPVNSLLVTEDAVVSLVTAVETPAGLRTEDESFLDTTRSYYGDVWEAAAEFSLRTPPLARVRSTLEAELGTQTRRDFDAVLESLSVVRGDGQGLDEVTISLLVAARNEQLLYDVSKWGEDVGLASKATFSRTKSTLEELGLLATEKVPIDVGRPRLRLLLGDERLRSADVDELADAARAMLA
ncbi:MAG: transcriptional regulator TbsP [Halorhabdus sp.]